MRLTILGCSGSVAGPDGPASGYLLEANGFTLGIEFGNGVLAQLQRLRGPFALDVLVLSHLHLDHCADVGSLTVLRRYHPTGLARGPRRLPLYGPADAAQRLANLYAADENERVGTDLSDVFDFHVLSGEPTRVGPFTVTAYEVLHPTPAYGLRIDDGARTLAYTGDTGVCPALDELAADADVLLSEATWTDADDRPPGVHLSGVEAGQLASRAGVRRLLLTHIAPWSDADKIQAEARAAYTGPLDVVTPGAAYDI